MFGTIRRHQTWLWAVIITLTVISFVVYFSPYSRVNSGSQRGQVNWGSINGERVTEEQFHNGQREAMLHYFIRSGRWPEEATREQLVRDTYSWLLLVQKQEQLGIHVSSQQAAEVAHALLRPFEQRSGPIPLEAFVSQVLSRQGLGADDFERFCRHYLGLQELIGTVGLSGKLLTPEELKALYHRQKQELATKAIFFSAANYLTNVTTTPEAIGQFYSNQLANYRIPDRVQVRYVEFGVSNFLGQAEAALATNLTALVETNLQRLGTNYLVYGKTPAEAKSKIREEILRKYALSEADKQAKGFANELLNMDPVSLDNLEKLARTNGLTVQTTAPFDKEEGPKELELGAEQARFAQSAFNRTADDPFAGPFVGENGVYEIGFYKRIPSEVPPLEQVRERVVNDYKLSQALNMARITGAAFYPAMTNGLAQGKTFDEVCQGANLKSVPLPAFSLSTRELPELDERINLNLVKQLAFSTPAGTASRFQPTADGGIILYVTSKLPVDEAKMRSELPAFAEEQRQRQMQDAFNLWFSKEAERGLANVPLLQQRPPPTMGTRPASS